MNRKIILNLYKTKVKLCQSQGYQLGSCSNIQPHFNLGKALVKLRKIRNNKYKAKFVMSHIKQAYNDAKYVQNDFLIGALIDEGFLALRNFDNFLNVPKKRIIYEDDDDEYIEFGFDED